MLNEHDTTAQIEETEDGFAWAIVEIFGHRRHVGRAREEERFGSKMLRIDVPSITPEPTLFDAADGTPARPKIEWVTHYYGGASIFSFTLTDEATVMRHAERKYASPALPFRDHGDVDDGDFSELED
ncbi:hypothetical protein X566_01310 [Afipia sp. P52-10]|uniref:hypothetical protein n=1 Tax=Afipia sp. P52-10 TaxID=1429916 RepID=UPI0003DF1CCB|nr:hypothetical protein [Afipia sp. P52-10]ETR79270.1 hypothetical protein X566_01310 [Afipia sp. P52-10]